MSNEQRLTNLRARMRDRDFAAFVSLDPSTNQYLADFRGTTSAIIVTHDEARFLCDFRYTEQAEKQVRGGYVIEEVKGGFVKRVGERLADIGARPVAFEPHYLSVEQLQVLESAAGGVFVSAADLAAGLRMVKDKGEIEKLREASALAEGVLADLKQELREGLPERELAARFEYEFRRRGASGASFDTIALFGARSSLPHGEPGDRKLAPGDVVLLDFGCRLNGYCSDLTRTYAFGTMPEAWFQAIYDLTLTAQLQALESVRAGVSCREVDAAARGVIAEAGHGSHFGHGLGHGVGIEIHEGPRLNPESDITLEAGMVVTIEPGIYLPGQGGVRIEDLVVVTEDGCELLSSTPKELELIKA